MNKSDFLVTVVVPTHNRSRYAIPCIKSMLEISSPLLQVVVHDTSDDDCDLKKWAEVQSDPRLKYVHWEERLSMTENHERALVLSEGFYVCLIGDDDSVSSRIVDVACYAKEEGFKLLTPRIKASYYWPDFRSKFYGDAHSGRLYLEHFDCRVEEFDVRGQLMKTLSRACQGTDLLPKLYHGLVRRDILDGIRERYGKVFFGTSPDISAALVISFVGGSYHVINYPFTLPGGAGGSNSGRSASGRHKGDLANDPHIKPFRGLVWPDAIPKFFSVETVWGQAAWETLSETNNKEWLSRFNLAKLYVLCAFKHPMYWSSILDSWRMARKGGIANAGAWFVLVEVLKFLSGKLVEVSRRLKHPGASNGKEVLAVVGDIHMARKELDRYLASHPAVFER